nr:MAG TPA: hypothetical protein [Caudoviricetes sp.]
MLWLFTSRSIRQLVERQCELQLALYELQQFLYATQQEQWGTWCVRYVGNK